MAGGRSGLKCTGQCEFAVKPMFVDFVYCSVVVIHGHRKRPGGPCPPQNSLVATIYLTSPINLTIKK